MVRKMLQLTEITKQYHTARFTLQPITLRLGRGLYLLCGPNGAGKSTLLKIIATVLRPDCGSVAFAKREATADLYRYRSNLGYLPQTFGFYNRMTGRDFLSYMAGLKGIAPRSARRRVAEVTEMLGLGPYYTGRIAAWSVGQRQQLGLAQALLNDPDLLLLDEPFSGLASQETERMARLLTRLARDKVIIVSSHLTTDLPLTGVLLLVDGYLEYAGSPDKFLAAAQGKVWAVEIEKEEWLKLRTQYPGSVVYFAGDRRRCKITSDRQPDFPEVTAISPKLEDAYRYWLRHCGERHGKCRSVSEGCHGN
jgi:ABC-2 type transport system ATP-binding protein